MIDVAFLLVFGVVTWCVSAEGAWGAAVLLFVIVLSGLLAMNFFEPVANVLSGPLGDRADFVALVGLFGLIVFLLRLWTEYLMPTFMQSPTLVYEFGRWGFGAAAGYVCAAFLLTSLHTAALPREFMGFKPERKNLFDSVAPDRQWLGFTQYVSERVFSNGRVFDGPENPPDGNIDPSYKRLNDRWPSFIIRYADRRQKLSGPAQQPPARVVNPGGAKPVQPGPKGGTGPDI